MFHLEGWKLTETLECHAFSSKWLIFVREASAICAHALHGMLSSHNRSLCCENCSDGTISRIQVDPTRLLISKPSDSRSRNLLQHMKVAFVCYLTPSLFFKSTLCSVSPFKITTTSYSMVNHPTNEKSLGISLVHWKNHARLMSHYLRVNLAKDGATIIHSDSHFMQ